MKKINIEQRPKRAIKYHQLADGCINHIFDWWSGVFHKII